MTESIKKIFIHIGPHKTGTSYIQYWLTNQVEFMRSKGFLYPKHSVEKFNKLSSGNFDSVFSKSDDDQIITQNADKLQTEFVNSNYSTLLLSSEKFVMPLCLNQLVDIFSDAKFIYYLRDPLDLVYSMYNQKTKREGFLDSFSKNTAIKLIQANCIEQIQYLLKIVKQNNLIFRIYDSALFYKNSIIADLLSCAN